MKTFFAGIRLDVLLVLAINSVILTYPSTGLGTVVVLSVITSLLTASRWSWMMGRANMKLPSNSDVIQYWLWYTLFLLICGTVASVAHSRPAFWIAVAACLLFCAHRLSREVNTRWPYSAAKSA